MAISSLSPAFLIGAGRSGTTLLYKILSSHRGVGYFSNYQSHFPGWTYAAVLHRIPGVLPSLKRRFWFSEDGGAYFNDRRRILSRLVPTPAEAESIYSLAGIPLIVEPGHRFGTQTSSRLHAQFNRVRRISGAKIMLSKRTANNRRLDLLNSIFPEAKYIHLVRDGRSVANSLLKVRWWDDHVLYWNGSTPRQMIKEGNDPLDVAARNWMEEMVSLDQGIQLLDPSQVLEVRYDSLLADVRGQLERMLDFLGVADVADRAFWEIVSSLSLHASPESWKASWSEPEIARVTRVQAPMLRRWGFPVELE
jgi:omega-hydroxy-beta-dihydromenaquinone-9 sulfotransferase